MRKKLYLGATAAAAVVLVSFGARALGGSKIEDVRRIKSQPRQRIEAALKLGVMPTADDLQAAQPAIQQERVRAAAKLPQPGRYTRASGRIQPQATASAGLTWVNTGPTDAAYEFNFSGIYGVDSGRPTALVVDPTNPDIVYDAVSGGGVWKTYNFVSGYPTPSWIPIGDTLPTLAVGALAIDPNQPGTLYLGTGDSFDVGGNQVFKSVDGGGTWGAPVTLSGTAPGQAVTFSPAAIRDLRVDPENGMNVLVATDQGLFRSTDGGATFAYVDLPNATANVMESTWSLAYVGNHSWLVSGVQACNTADKARGPRAGFGRYITATSCPLGNLGDIWRSTDSGATWTSLRDTANALPLPPASPTPTDDLGRMTLGVGPTTNPASTVVYVFVGNADEYNQSYTLGVFRSIDAGQTFQDVSGNYSVANPTLATIFQGTSYQDCADLDIGHDQTWYNQAILVDPQNADHVLFGGNLCGVRTLNGTAAQPTFENVSHWLPTGGGGTTSAGMLPYVHADWHAQAAFVVDGKTHAIAGTDGGVFSTANLWDATVTPPNVVWANHNKGLANHLFYTVASGDPATGDANVVYGGLQDNGTRMRNDLTTPTTFNQIIGGDGIGAAMNHGTAGTFMWGSSEFNYDLCANPAGTSPPVDCSNPGNWNANAPSVTVVDPGNKRPDPADSSPFFVRFVPVTTDATGYGMLTNTNFQVWLFADYTPPLPPASPETVGWETIPVTPPPGQSAPTTASLISPDFSLQAAPNGPAVVGNMAAHPTTANVFGVTLGAMSPAQTAPAAITENATQTVGAPASLTDPTTNRGSWKFATPVTLGNTTGGHLVGPQTIAFPLTQTGTPGDTYILGFSSARYSDGKLVPANVGHLFRTTDAGQTWTSIVGSDPNHQLPNVGVFVVKYDPVTPGVIYAGTLIGVYISKDDGATWDRFGDGLPMVLVRDLFVARNSDFVRIATYGRGIWEIYPSATASQGVQGDGDYDRNLQLDWVDLGAMGARLGTDPSTTATPLYTWIDDMNPGTTSPPAASIDENDLAQLLAGFGGHP